MTKAAAPITIQAALGTTPTNAPDSIATAAPTQKQIATLIAMLALRGHAVHAGKSGDFLVCKYGMSRYCQDFAALQAFARQLGVSHA